MADPFAQAGQEIQGDTSLALIAQVNRWKQRAGLPPYPLASNVITPAIAKDALTLLQSRLAIALTQSADLGLLNEMALIQRAYSEDPIGYVQARRVEIVQTLARYGDSLGLPPAEVGITRKPIATWKLVAGIGGGLLAIGTLIAMVAKSRRRGALPA